ncbi:MAG: hypothetical protein M3R63_04295 [Actinomycetota bacterium]|nr:hypothetical protein [Actinomycetota bacterium]
MDDTLSNGGLRSLAFDLRGLRPSAVTFLNAPVAGLSREGAQSVVYLDGSRSTDLWAALHAGTADGYADRYPADALRATTR